MVIARDMDCLAIGKKEPVTFTVTIRNYSYANRDCNRDPALTLTLTLTLTVTLTHRRAHSSLGARATPDN